MATVHTPKDLYADVPAFRNSPRGHCYSGDLAVGASIVASPPPLLTPPMCESDVEVYELGSPVVRVLGFLAVVGGAIALAIAHGPGTLWFAANFVLMGLMSLWRPYEVRIQGGKRLIVSSVFRIRELMADEISHVVRVEYVGSDKLSHFRIVCGTAYSDSCDRLKGGGDPYLAASITVWTSDEKVFNRVRSLNPEATLGHETYDPD